jgi:clan AA aspartic protease
MMTGIVNSNREATIRLVVRSAHGREHEIEAIIDTGFTGSLSLPSAFITDLGLVWYGRAQAILADGSVHVFDVYAATIIWDGQERIVEIDAADTDPLVGMGLIYNHEFRIQAVVGGIVTIDALR